MLPTLLAQLTPPAAETVASTAATVTAAPATAPVMVPMTDMNILHHMLSADPLVKLTLVVLIGFSVGCWAVIFYKLLQLNLAHKNTLSFWQKFVAVANFSEMTGLKRLRHGPVYEIFLTGQEALAKIKKITKQLTPYHRGYLEQRMRSVQEDEMFKLEQYLSFLATTASVAPFIGLLGTVWGILTAFLAIGKAGSSSLSTVGPYIAEALVATAVGLFAAIPAVIAYNYFVGKTKLIGKTVDLFVNEFLLRGEKEVAQ